MTTPTIWIASKQPIPPGAKAGWMSYMNPDMLAPPGFKGLNILDDETPDAFAFYDWGREPFWTKPLNPTETLLTRAITSYRTKIALAKSRWPKTLFGRGGLIGGYNMPPIRTYEGYNGHDKLNRPLLLALNDLPISCPCCYLIDQDPMNGIMSGVTWALDNHPRVVPILSPNTDPDHKTRSPLFHSLLQRLKAVGLTELFIWDATGLKLECSIDLTKLVQEIKDVWK